MSDTYDRFGVKVYPSVAEIGGDKTVKIDRFDGVTALHGMNADDRRINCEHWRGRYILQAQELAGRAFLMIAASTEDRAMYHATRMISKAAYAMRQAQRVDEALRRMTL